MPKKPKFQFTDEQLEFFRAHGAIGGAKGAAGMSPRQRKLRAKKAIAARWGKKEVKK